MKRHRPIPRILRRILFLIAFMFVAAAGCTVWAANCEEPQDLQFSTDFAARIQQNLNSPSRLTWMLYDELSHLLRWYGNSSLYMMHFGESCEVTGCSIDDISMIVEVAHRPICSWSDNNFNHSFVSVKIEEFTTLESEITIDVIRWGYGAYRPLLTRFAAEIDWVRDRARQAMDDSDWTRNPTIMFHYFSPHDNWRGKSWDVYIYAASGKQLYSIDVPHPEPTQALPVRTN